MAEYALGCCIINLGPVLERRVFLEAEDSDSASSTKNVSCKQKISTQSVILYDSPNSSHVIVVPSLKVIHSRVLIQGDTSIIKKGARQLFLYVPTYL